MRTQALLNLALGLFALTVVPPFADDTFSTPQWQPSKYFVKEDPAAQNGTKRDAKW